MSRRKTTLTCPLGHTFRIPPMVYGYPTQETLAAADRGEVTIAGCDPGDPVERPCPTCGRTASSDPELTSGMTSERPIDGQTAEPDRPF